MQRYFPVFQFHKGTIKTSCSYDTFNVREQFQFHKGTIKTLFVRKRFTPSVYFNSIKVQLKRTNRLKTKFIKLFQFHKGTIKTLPWVMLLLMVMDFNSIKVQLKLSKTIGIVYIKQISIP